MVILNTTSLVHDARVRKEASALAVAGHTVRLVGLTQPGARALSGRDGFEVVVFQLRSRQLPWGPLGWPLKYAEFLARSLVALLRFRARAYHAHDLDALIPAWLAARITGALVVYDAHELYTERPIELPSVWRVIERFLIRRVDVVIAASEERAEIMHREYGARERPTVIANCPARSGPTPMATIRDRLPPDARHKRIVVYQGGLSAGRCLESLTLAAGMFEAQAVLAFVGNPTSFSESVLRPLAAGPGLEGRVHFVPAVDASEVVPFIATADVGVVIYKNTCRNNYFCAPNKLYDYCMAGLPVVGVDFPPVRRLVQEFDLGGLFDPERPEAIATAVNALLSDPDARDRAVAGSRAVARVCNWEEESRKLIDVYRRLEN